MAKLSRPQFGRIVDTYCRAWRTKDTELILTLFAPDAIYHERPFELPIVGHNGIRSYWDKKVAQEQENVRTEILNLYIDGQVGIAEWLVEFDDLVDNERKRMREVAILSISDDLKITHLREFWSSQKIRALEAAHGKSRG